MEFKVMSTYHTSTYGRLLSPNRSFFTTLLRRMRVHRERQALRELDDRMLRDIGVSRSDANRESLKRFWQE
jgi:uncharacterized protein YjiS (DUF1127 family)